MQRGKFDLNFEQLYLDAQNNGVEVKLEEELYSFVGLIRKNYEFKLFLEDPRIDNKYKKKRLDEICPSGITSNFLATMHILIDNGREELIGEISKSFTKRLAQEKKILFGEVTSVCPITAKMQEQLEQVMKKIEKQKVKLRYRLDPNLLGGLCVKFINGEVWDVSLKHKLDELKNAILER